MPLEPINELLPKLVKPQYLEQARLNWKILAVHLNEAGLRDEANHRALCATVLVETAHQLRPIHEFGSHEYFKKMYWQKEDVRNALGNILEKDAIEYAGRGFIQLTGRHNYEKCAGALNLPLMSQPELMLKPDISARATVWFWTSHGLPTLIAPLAGYKDQPNRDAVWTKVRKRINGGTNGLEAFLRDLAILQIR